MALTCPTCERSGTECTCNRGYLILRKGQVVEFQPDWNKAYDFLHNLIERDASVLRVIDWNPVVNKINLMMYEITNENPKQSITYRIMET